MFYAFIQNNSGGRFHREHADGISHYVVVEGQDYEEIIRRAETIGLYFDGCESGRDCSCCGDRWYRPWGDSELTETPTIYGVEVSSGDYVDQSGYGTPWIKDGPEGYIHYLNGTIQPVVYKCSTPKKKK